MRNVNGTGDLFRRVLKEVIIGITLMVLFAACGRLDSLTDEMDIAYSRASAVSASDDPVSEVVNRHFPIETPLEAVLDSLLRDGYRIREYGSDGSRDWPHGTFVPYMDGETKRWAAQRYEHGEVGYVAENTYSWRVVVSKRAVISIESDGKRVLDIKGFVYVDGI